MRDFKLKSLEPGPLAQMTDQDRSKVVLLVITLLLVTMFTAELRRASAQKIRVPSKVSNIASQTSPNGSLVTIAADSPLSRAQTWQDEEGFHVVLPNTVSAEALKPGKGIKIRRVGSSLEILAQTRPGTRVSVSPAPNQLNLIIDGKLDTRRVEPTEWPTLSSEEKDYFQERPQAQARNSADTYLPPVNRSVASAPSTTATITEHSAAAPTVSASSSAQQLPSVTTNQIVTPAQPAPASIVVQTEDESVFSSVFSGTGVLVVLALGMVGFLVSRKVRSVQAPKVATKVDIADFDELAPEPESTTALVRAGETSLANRAQKESGQRLAVAGPTSLFGAYRIDQEVGKLVLGQPHRIDVLSSRAIDDRRAIETSLIKGLNSQDLDETGKRKAREALEEYGFVARQCAALLLAPDAFERTSAARLLGDIKSPAALPFLLEGLYDSESIVRNQAVMSIGELKIPSAIGALLDIARTHPDVPSALLSRTLSACSVEGLDFFDAVVSDAPSTGPADVGMVVREIDHLEMSMPVENLPIDSDDPSLLEALNALESPNVEERSEALKIIVQFRVQNAVDAIAGIARNDPASTIRSLAISSLGTINHESVFAAVLMGMADESREVRAAAARSINRLSFDRADAYARVTETSDDTTLRCVAQACIQAGIVSQNLDRLTYADHRQAYETFSLICLLTKAGMNEPILEAIADHPRMDVRLKAIYFLGCTGRHEVLDQLRELAVRDGIGEVVKTALLEAMYKLDQNKRKENEEIQKLVVEDIPSVELGETEAVDVVNDFSFDLGPLTFDNDAHTEADQYEV
jgi:HEAT repeat protein